MSGILSPNKKSPKQNAIMISPKDGWSADSRSRAENTSRYKGTSSVCTVRHTVKLISYVLEIDTFGNDCGITKEQRPCARAHPHKHGSCLRGILAHRADPRRIIPPKRELRLMNRRGICIVKRVRL